MNSLLIRVQCVLLLALAAFLATVQPAPALNLYVYDLDSLAYMSAEIVEADVVRQYQAHMLDLIDIKITAVHKGMLKAGQTVAVAATDFYRKDDLKSVEHIGVGDKVILFLFRAKATPFYPVPDNAEIYMPSPSGVRLVEGDMVLGFSQWMNPGPYNLDRPGPKNQVPTLKVFRKQVGESVTRTDKLKREFGLFRF